MDAAAAIVATAVADDAVAALIGAAPASRIAPVGMADNMARPNVILQQINGTRNRSNDGPTGLQRSTVQLTAYADDYAAARQLAKALADALDGFSGTAAGVEVRSCLLDDDNDAPRPPQAGRSQGIAGVVLAFRVTWATAA